MTAVAFSAVDKPYAVVGPYSTWLSDSSLVAREIVAPVEEIEPDATLLIAGGLVPDPPAGRRAVMAAMPKSWDWDAMAFLSPVGPGVG